MKAGACIAGLLTVAIAVAGCGGSGNTSSGGTATGTATAPASTGPAAARRQIRQNWIAFFAASTPAQRRISLLQNGTRYAPIIRAQAKSPLARQTKATVSSVTLHGGDRATVVYTISLAGKPVLENQRGVAVRSGGMWKVGVASFCRLVGLQGSPPAGCPKNG